MSTLVLPRAILSKRWAIGYLSLLVFALYANSFHNPFLFDDMNLIVENVLIRQWRFLPQLFSSGLTFGSGGVATDFYRPLQSVSYLLEYQLWHLNPFGYHLTNTLLHLVNSCLLYGIIRRLTRRPGAALAASALFAAHPVHTQAVTYISGRADVLAVGFGLLGLWYHLQAQAQPARTWYRAATAVCVALGLLSKELALLFPLILVAADACFLTDSARWTPRAALARYALLMLVMVAYLGLRLYIPHLESPFQISHPLSVIERLWTSLGALWSYLRLLVLPIRLHMCYNTEAITTLWHPRVLSGLVLLALSVGYAIRSTRRDPQMAFFGWWTLIGLLPVLNLISLNAVVAEHWWYLPSMGAIVCAVLMVARRLPSSGRFARAVARGALITIVAGLGVLTIRQNQVWSDPVVFFSYTLRYAPQRLMLYVLLGDALYQRGQEQAALDTYQHALALDPTYYLALGAIGRHHLTAGQYAKAQRWYEQAIESRGRNVHPALSNDLGIAYLHQGQIDNALEQFQHAVAVYPYRPELWANVGRAYAQRHQTDRAIEAFERALTLDPNHLGSHTHLGNLYVLQHRYREAIPHYQQAIRVQPDPRVYLNLGICHLHLDQPHLAKQAWEQALKLKPDYDEAQVNLALLKRSAIH